MKNLFITFVGVALFYTLIVNIKPTHSTSHSGETAIETKSNDTLLSAHEKKHLKNLRQLTFGGDNAEAYWSFDNSMLVFQSNYANWGVHCDQIFYGSLNQPNFNSKMISTGKGRTTCSYFLSDNKHIVYASTHLHHDSCPPEKPRTGHYTWPIFSEFDIFVADLNGTAIKQLTNNPGYDAEATISPDGKKMVFTSIRSGDLELYVMDLETGVVTQITNELGYDGGAFFSPDSKMLVYRASRPKTTEEVNHYKKLLSMDLVEPKAMEIFVCNVDGTNHKQVTNLGGANWAPFFHPSGNKIIFCSNHVGGGFNFQLYLINIDGSGLEQITTESRFNSFPMYSFDGKKLVFSSNRNNNGTRDTNLFVAEWTE